MDLPEREENQLDDGADESSDDFDSESSRCRRPGLAFCAVLGGVAESVPGAVSR